MNLKTIIKAWAISFNPDDKQSVLAEARLKVCTGCEKLSKKKIYTDEYNPCPLYKWKDTDDKHFDLNKVKVNKSII